MPKFKKGDICRSHYKSKKKINGNLVEKQCLVRIIKHIPKEASDGSYRVYNIDFNRYEEFGEIWLTIDRQTTRKNKLKEILDLS